MASLLPTITSRRATSLVQAGLVQASAREILDSLKTFAADGGARPNSGGTPFRQPCPAYPSTKGRKAPQERFSEEKSPNSLHPETHFSNSTASCLPTRQQTHSTQQAWMYSRNQTTIASALKHRQLVFLHPTDVSNEEAKQNARLNENNPCGRGFEILRKKRSGFRQEAPARKERSLTPPCRLNLPILLSASTLQVFHFIGTAVRR